MDCVEEEAEDAEPDRNNSMAEQWVARGLERVRDMD